MTQTAFDIQEGLQRLMGNQDLYKQVLKKFADQFQNVGAELDALLEHDNITEAESVIHTVKGVAGNLSAVALHKAAQDYGSVLKQGKTDDDLRTKFQDEMEKALRDIEVVMKELS